MQCPIDRASQTQLFMTLLGALGDKSLTARYQNPQIVFATLPAGATEGLFITRPQGGSVKLPCNVLTMSYCQQSVAVSLTFYF